MMERGKIPPMDECVKGRIYRIRARNFRLGVYDGAGGFIGIREKFGQLFLDTEYHWDADKLHGTVAAAEDTGIDVPPGIIVAEGTGSFDQVTGRPVKFDRPIADGGRGWYFTDTGEASTAIRSVNRGNKSLFDFLEKLELSQLQRKE